MRSCSSFLLALRDVARLKKSRRLVVRLLPATHTQPRRRRNEKGCGALCCRLCGCALLRTAPAYGNPKVKGPARVLLVPPPAPPTPPRTGTPRTPLNEPACMCRLCPPPPAPVVSVLMEATSSSVMSAPAFFQRHLHTGVCVGGGRQGPAAGSKQAGGLRSASVPTLSTVGDCGELQACCCCCCHSLQGSGRAEQHPLLP